MADLIMNSYIWTGERLVSAIQDETATEHLHRYGLSLAFCRGKDVLDIACGEGYGSSFIADVAHRVTGVDIDADVISFAQSKYKKANLRFMTGSAFQIPLPDSCVDVVVSFETIEHHDKHDEMLTEIKRVLRPGGLAIISTPDKKHYSDERNFVNHFHVKELTRTEFGELLDRHFKNTQMLSQRICYGSLILPEQGGRHEFGLLSGDYASLHPFPLNPLYHISISSDEVLPEIQGGFFDGSRNLQSKVDAVYSSMSYQIGYRILQPFRFIRKILGRNSR